MTSDTTTPTCFIIMPLTVPAHLLDQYRDDEKHFIGLLDGLFKPAIEMAGLRPVPPIAEGGEVIQAKIGHELERADLVLCDISALNPNVFFELGVRTAMDKPVCMVRDDHLKAIPFDTGIVNCFTYGAQPSWSLDEQRTSLAAHIQATMDAADGHNELWRLLSIQSRAQVREDDPMASMAGMMEVIGNRMSRLERAVVAEPNAGPMVAPDRRVVVRRMDEHLSRLTSRYDVDWKSAREVQVNFHGQGGYEAVRVAEQLSDLGDRLGVLIRATNVPYDYEPDEEPF